MTQDEIIEMAKQAHAKLVTDVYVGHISQLDHWTIELLKIFAKLVEKHEREACLKFCDEVSEHFPSSGFVGSYIGNKIRNRGQA